MDPIFTGTGQLVEVHEASVCGGDRCCVHNPSNHPLKTARLHWRADREIMERICAHGVGHPDPDDVKVRSHWAETVHGCDGCCRPSDYLPRSRNVFKNSDDDEW